METKSRTYPETPAVEPAPNPATPLALFHASSLRDALLAARRERGARAVVVDQESDEAGVRIVVSTAIPRSAQALREMRDSAGAMLEATRPELAPEPPRSQVEVSPTRSPLADVERRLRENGATRRLRERILAAVVEREGEETPGGAPMHPLDLAAEEVGSAFPIAHLPAEEHGTAILALVGQTGVGKTTTLAKLALRLVRAGRRVALASLDVDRVGAAAQLRAYGETLRVPAIALRDPERIAAELARAPGRLDVLLVDGSGDEGADTERLRRLEEACRAAGAPARLSSLVVLPATASEAALESATSAAEPLEPIGAVVTKLDEAERSMPALEHALACGLGLAFFTNGPELGPHFHRASVERIADVALVGRIG